jgi:hypothetical protein
MESHYALFTDKFLVGLAVATLFLLNNEAVGAVVFFAVAMGYLPFVVD